MGFETSEEIMADEMEKQRRKLRDISQTLDTQHQLLRLIVQVRYSSSNFDKSSINQQMKLASNY